MKRARPGGRAFSVAKSHVPQRRSSSLNARRSRERASPSWRSHGFPPSRSILGRQLLIRIDSRLCAETVCIRHHDPIVHASRVRRCCRLCVRRNRRCTFRVRRRSCVGCDSLRPMVWCNGAGGNALMACGYCVRHAARHWGTIRHPCGRTYTCCCTTALSETHSAEQS